MSTLSTLLSQCLEITQQLIKNKQSATINIRVGEDFIYHFSNQESSIIHKKKFSPSQRKRNEERKQKFEQKRVNDEKSDIIKVEKEVDEEQKVSIKNSAVQTDLEDIIEKKDYETQTETMQMESIGVNTEEEEINSLEKNLEVDENGVIKARKNEVLVEIKFNPDVKNWEEIKGHISENLKLTLIGNPWIANSGRHYMTIGLRTKIQDYENWKLRTFNWQESGIRAVSSSRLYR